MGFEFETINDLHRIPITRRVDIANSPVRFLSEAHKAERFWQTSGTMGHRLIFYGDQSEEDAQFAMAELHSPASAASHGLHMRIVPGPRRASMGNQKDSQRPTILVGYTASHTMKSLRCVGLRISSWPRSGVSETFGFVFINLLRTIPMLS
jgi:phenylacetate-coenzyme A ligase PaaK-like adenylate-forming protein